MKENRLSALWHRDGTRSVLASLISILIGLAAGSLIILLIGCFNKNLGLKSAWDGIRLVVLGPFSTGRNASGALTFGFNPASIGNMLFRATPVILTGLSVAVANKTGLFNIGAAGQYLMGTAATLFIALGVPSTAMAIPGVNPSSIPPILVWLLALLGGMLAGAAGSLYYLSGNTEFYWSTYQSLPAAGFNGIPVALLAVSNPIGVIFSGIFMSMLDISGLQLTNLTAYNEYITDVIIAVIVYLAAFSLVIKLWLGGKRRRRAKAVSTAADSGAAKEAEQK